jgi:hypothetical protein
VSGALLPSPAMEIMGIEIRTILNDNVATRCDGCNEIIEGTPWRVNVLDIVRIRNRRSTGPRARS